MEKLLFKQGYYSVYEVTVRGKTKYRVDSGKTLFVARFNKYIPNPYRDIKDFTSLSKSKEYISKKLKKSKSVKKKKLDKVPKSLYLVLLKEEKSGKTFVKVGITSKRFIMRRFSKKYGYEGYTLESILRRLETPRAERLEESIKLTLKKKRSVKSYRPLLESFGGYTECYEYGSLETILKVFDSATKNV
ncbi:hypothetical protein N9H34_01510 [bacterium]|nr:hypothetical protein [bacterium]